MGMQVMIVLDDTPPRDPMAYCERCGVQGTTARLTIETTPRTLLRFCTVCWPAARAEFEARSDEEHDRHAAAWRRWAEIAMRDPAHAPPGPAPRPAYSMDSRVWHDVREFLALIGEPPVGGARPTSSDLAKIARDIVQRAPEFDEPMPSDVAEFVARHA
jgi:hypothetical protein